MKQYLKYIASLLFIAALFSCTDVNDEFEGLSEKSRPNPNQSEEYVLTPGDYEIIAGFAYDEATSAYDSSVAAFIEAYEHFNDTIKAAKYVPALLAQMYPSFSPGANAIVTYNYNGEMPEDLATYTDALSYELYDEDYSSPDSMLNLVKFYSPSYQPSVYIPLVLNNVVAAPEDGDLILVGYEYAETDPKIDFEASADLIIYSQDFEGITDLSDLTTYSSIGDQEWNLSSYSGNFFAKMSGYDGGSNANEDWLITPAINLDETDNEVFSFNTMTEYAAPNFSVKYSLNYSGTGDPSAADWVNFSGYSISTDNFELTNSGLISLSELSGSIHIAFVYYSSDTETATIEVDDILVTAPTDIAIIGKAPEFYQDYFSYSEDEGWTKEQDIYYVNAVDYDAMGAPGKYNNFSASDKPDQYLPNLLKARYPLAGQDYEVVTVYKYFNSANYASSILADRYTYNNGEWESSYNFVDPKTDQFLVSQNYNWVFDPTISLKMTSEDFQIIVDWVSENKGESYIDDYGTAEFYTGAAAYYVNFDIREGSYESAEFESWQDAVAFSIGKVFLPAKFPNAVEMVDGVEMFYIVNFDTFSGSDGNSSMKFQVTKAGPDPEFTFVEILE